MKIFYWPLLTIILALTVSDCPAAGSSRQVAPKPLYRDTVYDGAADPTLIWNPMVKRWWMYYTDRRANVPGLTGVAWVHGTPIGIAESADGGATWKFIGMAKIDLPAEYGGANVTEWAPDVQRAPDGSWQMFLTVVPGIFENWDHPRDIVQLTSTDMLHWGHPNKISLASDRVIDPSILHMPDGTWRMWYNDERASKSINYADSPDMMHWTDKGLAFPSHGEGPKGFRWHNKYWVIVDEWKGLAVYRSDDASHWSRQLNNLLADKGKGEDDQAKGDHCDMVVSGNRAFLFYFCQFGRRSSIQVVELRYKNGWLTADRDQPTHIRLLPEK